MRRLAAIARPPRSAAAAAAGGAVCRSRSFHTTAPILSQTVKSAAGVRSVDYLVIGGGIAGASTAYYLTNPAGLGSSARRPSVAILERESQPGVHSTGRSAALYSETYGNATIRALTVGSRAAYHKPPPGFTEGGQRVLAPRGCLYIGNSEQLPLLQGVYRDGSKLVNTLRTLKSAEVLKLCPLIRPEYAIDGCVYEPDAEDIDVAAVHAGFLRGVKSGGGQLFCDSDVASIKPAPASGAAAAAATAKPGSSGWDVTTRSGTVYRAGTIVNAAGAWADVIGQLCGATLIGLQPKRRTIIVFRAPEQYATADVNRWPFVMDCDESYYFKPDAGQMWGSPADETLTLPCDAQPDELDMAVAIERIQSVTSMTIPRLTNRWAGLRSFVADKSPVVGFDPKIANFLWVAGQGGYGIQTCFAMGEVSAAMALRQSQLPKHVTELGLTAAELAVDRPALRNATPAIEAPL